MVPYPGQQVAQRFRVGSLRGQDGGELRLSAGALEVADQLSCDAGGGRVAVVVRDQREGQVDAGGDARGRPDVAVVHVDGVMVDRDVGVGVAEQRALRPVRRGTSSRRQAGCRQHERAGADEVTRRASVARRLTWSSRSVSATAAVMSAATCHEQRVHRASNLAERRGREFQPAAGTHGAAGVVTIWVTYCAAGRKRDVLENTSSGPGTSRIWAASNVDDHAPLYGRHSLRLVRA